MKKLASIILAIAMISVFTLGASAIANANGADYDEDGKYVFEGKGTITGFTISFDDGDVEEGFGGGIIWYGEMFEEGWWAAAGGSWTEWGDEDAGKAIVSDGATIKVTLDEPIEADGPVVMMEQWWGDEITITGIVFDYAVDDNDDAPPVISPAPGGDDDDDKHGAETGVADVAVASAIALVAAGAVVFARKRK
ncbi:MAG: hypothetical protein LBC82_02025 [Oscillospiraceae bacterium]|jgi:hypothetical protein|nr:hypothetical protein [Oscillospiraceae bacterium]